MKLNISEKDFFMHKERERLEREKSWDQHRRRKDDRWFPRLQKVIGILAMICIGIETIYQTFLHFHR